MQTRRVRAMPLAGINDKRPGRHHDRAVKAALKRYAVKPQWQLLLSHSHSILNRGRNQFKNKYLAIGKPTIP
ncbi:hypothetical protein FHW58_001064 [Duganella sp. 1224]|nr:hypothetical protein [Duganella sp. 1224]